MLDIGTRNAQFKKEYFRRFFIEVKELTISFIQVIEMVNYLKAFREY